MLETIDARTSIPRAPRGVGAWHYRRSAQGVTSFTHPAPPSGVSLCTYTRTPAGDHRLRVEGNLTTLLHGDGAQVLSLHADELDDAAAAFVDAAADTVGERLPSPMDWALHRLDPSMTFQAAPGETVGEVIARARIAWGLRANVRQVVTQHNASTVTFRQSKWRSWSAYDKGAEFAAHGGTPPLDGLVRLEARIRPRQGSGDWKTHSPSLQLDDTDKELIMAELDEMMTSLVSRMAATGMVGMVRSMVEGGASVNSALRLSAYAMIANEFGQDVFDDLHTPDSTTRRWRAEIRKHLGGSEASADEAIKDQMGYLAEVASPLFARDFQVTRRPQAGDSE